MTQRSFILTIYEARPMPDPKRVSLAKFSHLGVLMDGLAQAGLNLVFAAMNGNNIMWPAQDDEEDIESDAHVLAVVQPLLANVELRFNPPFCHRRCFSLTLATLISLGKQWRVAIDHNLATVNDLTKLAPDGYTAIAITGIGHNDTAWDDSLRNGRKYRLVILNTPDYEIYADMDLPVDYELDDEAGYDPAIADLTEIEELLLKAEDEDDPFHSRPTVFTLLNQLDVAPENEDDLI